MICDKESRNNQAAVDAMAAFLALYTPDSNLPLDLHTFYLKMSVLMFMFLFISHFMILAIPMPEFTHLVQFIPETNMWQWTGMRKIPRFSKILYPFV